MSSTSSVGRQLSRNSGRPGKKPGENCPTSSSTSGGGSKSAPVRRRFRRVVQDLEDEESDDAVSNMDNNFRPTAAPARASSSTSPKQRVRSRNGVPSSSSTAVPVGRSLSRKGSRPLNGSGASDASGVPNRTSSSAGSRPTNRAREKPAAASDAGTSSGEEDNAWFKKPSKNAGASSGESGDVRRPENTPSTPSAVKVKRAKALADPGWLSRSDPNDSAQRQKNAQLAKVQRQATAGKKAGREFTKRRVDNEHDRDANRVQGRRKREIDASARRSSGVKKGLARGGRGKRYESEESCGTSASENEEEEGEFESDSESESENEDLELTDASEGEENANTAQESRRKGEDSRSSKRRRTGPDSYSTKRLPAPAPGTSSSRKGVEKDGCVAQVDGRNGKKPTPSSSSSSASRDVKVVANGVRDTKQDRGSSVSNRSSTSDNVARVASASVGKVSREKDTGSGDKSAKRDPAGPSGKQPKPDSMLHAAKQAKQEPAAASIVKKDSAPPRTANPPGAVGEGDGVRNARNRRVKRLPVEDDSAEDETPKKKKKMIHVPEEDDMDESDRGSDSDDEGARARKVLEECSALSKKLASVISSWAASEEEKEHARRGSVVGSDKGALEITQMTEGKSMTTDEEIQEACPGLKLNPYQLVGVNWMCLLQETGVNGVLADEMGLGKTVQTIAFFALLRHRRKGMPPRRPHLIVVPSSVLDNWDSELRKFCSALDVVKYHGTMKDRSAIRQRLNRVAAGGDREGMPDIMLTTYVIWERESCGDDRNFLKRFKYDYMVLDEGHSIKNVKSSRFQRLRMVVSKHRLLLSGTPVQNNLGELLALLSFLMPAIFRTDVMETLAEFLADGESASSSSSASAVQVREVRGMLAPFVLRRLKSGVLKQLVAKTERVEMVPLSELQQTLYSGVLEEHVRQKRAAIERALEYEKAARVTDGDDGASNITRSSVSKRNGSTAGAEGKKERGGNYNGHGDVLEAAGISTKEIKNVFTELRKGANHPLMLLNYYKEGGKMDEVINVLHRTEYFGNQASRDMVAKEVSTYSDFDLHQLCSNFDSLKHLALPEETLFTSAKMERLRTLLPELVSKGHRILLFSQWTRLLDLLEVLLQDSMGLKFCRLDGSTPVGERKALIDRFGSDRSIKVFLLSTRAGGLGINLTSADTVILHDVDFNPENDRQAEDRCHRIGQTKPVTVIKMVAEGTVDEDIYTMGERKKEVNKSVLNDAATKEPDSKTISGILKRAIQGHLSSSR